MLFETMESNNSNQPLEEISKALEIINFNTLWGDISQQIEQPEEILTIINRRRPKGWNLKKIKVSPESKAHQSQIVSFQSAMKLLFIIGQCFGLNPVVGISERDIGCIRFSMLNWRFIYSVLICLTQAITTVFCFLRLLNRHVTIQNLGYLAFYMTACVTTLMFIKIGKKWHKLIKLVSVCSLNEYVDLRLKSKCVIVTVTIVTISTVEHLLSVVCRVTNALKLWEVQESREFYDVFLKVYFPWLFDLNIIQPNMPLGILLQILNYISTINWNYLDVYVICLSLYLESILNKINEKIHDSSEKHYLTSSQWRSLREDYTRAIQLVRSFDEIFSGLVFTSFASNMFFICLQLFNILSYFVQSGQEVNSEHKGLYGGVEYTFYLLFSMTYMLARSLAVSLVAASVHTASLVPATALYNVPSSSFCCEVSRFLDQVHNDSVAFSGLHFFYVTRELVLSVAGAIVTYELVLLQFSGEEIVRRL